MADPFYITTAINYPNGRPHIGHAYEAIATDAIARFQRQMGRDVFFLTGTDEHGLKMAQTARDRGVEPAALAEEMSSYFREMERSDRPPSTKRITSLLRASGRMKSGLASYWRSRGS